MSRVCILFGGQSTEHEISLLSAKNIISALDCQLVLIGIDKSGQWWHFPKENFIEHPENPKKVCLAKSEKKVSIHPGAKEPFRAQSPMDEEPQSLGAIDCVFPVLHGTNGEDGTIQGLLSLLGLPFVGCKTLGSAACMDKDVTKRLLRDSQINVCDWIALRSSEPSAVDFETAEMTLGTPIFVKPANLGSSVGVSKVSSMEEYYSAISEAFRLDNKLLLEEAVKGRELECAVLGNENPVASLPGEVIGDDFYSYEEKYLDSSKTKTQVPADLPQDLVRDIQITAIKTYKALECQGMARVDFFLTEDGKLFINEVNTIPGFTSISMYPKMWEASGTSYKELLGKLIELGKEAWASNQS